MGNEPLRLIRQQLRKAGNSYAIRILEDDVERNGCSVGDRFAVQLTPLEERPALSDEIRAEFEASWEQNEVAYRYLTQ